MKETEFCGNCKYWRNDDSLAPSDENPNPKGECRRHAPRYSDHPQSTGTEGYWPTTQMLDWCGEFKLG